MGKRIAVSTLLILLVGAGYYLYRFGLRKPSLSMLTSKVDDSSITDNVKTALGLSTHLAGMQVNVKTEGGVVTLSGEVQSEVAKEVAGSIARGTNGVADVKNLLMVNPSANASPDSLRVKDIDIKADLVQALQKSPSLSPKKLDVKVENQVVTLAGTVDTPADKSAAEQLARSIDGVNAVTDNLTVANPQPAPSPGTQPQVDPNAELAKLVEFELYRSGSFDLSTMKITASNGAVTLSGTVRSRAEQLLADKIAQTVDGVKTVSDELKVK